MLMVNNSKILVMSTNPERIQNRTAVSWKVDDILHQFAEIESLVEEFALTDSDINFLSNMNTVRSNLEIYFANWKRGTKEDIYEK